MSAAAPLPPLTHAAAGANAGSNSGNGGGGNGGERVYAHISDLQSDALAGLSRNSSQSYSITTLFAEAEKSLKDAEFNIDFRRPDVAFVAYLRAYEIAVQVIPHHRDYVHFIHDQHGQSKLHVLQRRIAAMTEQFANIKQIIVNNNSRSAVRPRSLAGEPVGQKAEKAVKSKPSISPKPEKLHSRPISMVVNGSPGHDIADRFAKLRGPGGADTSSRVSVSLPRGPLERDNVQSFAQSAPKPHGPRGMPLDTELAAAMPKAPAATYSPARNMQTTGDIALPRHSARSLVSQRKSTSLSSPVLSATASNGASTGNGGYFSANHRTGTPTRPQSSQRHKSVQMPDETRITAEKLHDYLERYDIMVIDCRARAEFDQGHIYSRNVICIEPVGLRQGMSAEQLADKLVLSPEEEQDIFQHRDQYDLVVYHDASTKSETFLSDPASEAETHLKYLHEALYDFNQEKQLKRPPIVLMGGIDAWVDLMGNQALMATTTQARAKTGRPLQRRPALRDGPMRVSKRGLRDYNPLDAEEEQKWRDRAQSESMPAAPGLGDHGAEEDAESDSEQSQRFPHIDEFNARFPEAGVIGQHPYSPASSITTPRTGTRVPHYPATPAHSVYPPPPPARPAPAAPRMSYTGVSDRAVSHSTPIPRTSSQLLPYVPQRFLAQNLRLPRTGIHNFGNTCYMNATLQALSATTPLTILMLDDQYKKMVQKDNWKGSRGLLPEIYANLVRSLWQGGVDYIKPSTMLTFCGRLNSTFKDPSQQQDAQEFFSFLVDCLHEDFNTVWSKMPLRVLTEQEEAKRERMPALVVAKTEWGRYIHRENSFLTSLFYGQHSSRLRCSTCSFTSTTYEAWALLQVEIPEFETRLQECLRSHFRSEELDGENQWTCPRCKVPRRATKKLTMTRAPPFLVVALKRFKQNARGEQRKLSTAVRFPLLGLDMEEFILPQPSPSEAQEIAHVYGSDALKVDDCLSPPYVYDAYAVVRHMGSTTTSGHYTCVARDKARGCWRIFNDTQHRDIQPETLSSIDALDNNQAYFVFYERRATANESNGA